MLTRKTPGTLLDFWNQPQWWLFGVWYNFFFSADDHDINTTVAKMMDQKCSMRKVIRKSYLKNT